MKYIIQKDRRTRVIVQLNDAVPDCFAAGEGGKWGWRAAPANIQRLADDAFRQVGRLTIFQEDNEPPMTWDLLELA